MSRVLSETARGSVLLVACAALPAMAQPYAECLFDDAYWDATCPTQGFTAGCHRWHLIDEDAPYADINVCPVWDMGYTGTGVTIGIIDLGIRIDHEDLANRYNASASTDHCDDSSHLCLGHGTYIAGLMVAEADNQLGIVGVAHGASFAEIVIHADCDDCDGGNPRIPTDDELTCALRHDNADNDIKTISLFGGFAHITPSDGCSGLGSCAASGDCVAEAIEEAALTGRGELGTVLVVSAGNSALDGARTDYSRFTSHRYTIAVGGMTHEDEHWCEADIGSSLFLVAPTGDTSECGAPSENPPWKLWSTKGVDVDEYGSIAGTSYSAPIVGGVVALMLEADDDTHGFPTMSVRDVMHAFANTSRKLDAADSGWDTNNGTPSHDVNYKYGFGAVDAYAAVTHITDSEWRRALSERVIDSGMINPDLTVPASGAAVSHTFTIQSSTEGNHLRVEHVELVLYAALLDIGFGPTTTDMGNLKVTLRGPNVGGHRTESLFADFRTDETATSYNDFVFTSVRHWDELAVGNWTIEFRNDGDDPIFVHGCQIRIYGTPYCRGDFNADGTADNDDLTDFLAAYVSEETGVDGKPLADYDGIPGLNDPGDQDAFEDDLTACQ